MKRSSFFIPFLNSRIFLAVSLFFSPCALHAQDLNATLIHAYQLNPTLNAARANLRNVDENVPIAKQGYRPRVSASSDYGRNWQESKVNGYSSKSEFYPGSVGLSVTQPVYTGGRVSSAIKQAESNVLGAREQLRNTEQNVLMDAITAHVNVVRDSSILSLRKNNVGVLAVQVRQTKDRFTVGEVTKTDVAQAEARLAQSKSDLILAEANFKASGAKFKQVTGLDAKKLQVVKPFSNSKLPKSKELAMKVAVENHPAIIAALHGVDAQLLQVRVVEADFYPVVSLGGSLSRRFDVVQRDENRNNATVTGQISIPIYDGGLASAKTRQAEEGVSEKRLQVDSSRDEVVRSLTASWAQWEATGYQITSALAQTKAAEIALNGVKEEARVGQRTTLDVLNAEQELLNARVSQVTAQRDRVVASYSLLSSIGKLSIVSLDLNTDLYDPTKHFKQTKDIWYGAQTPSGE